MTSYHNSPEDFNNYFLTISENLIKDIRLNKQQHDTDNSPIYYLLNQPRRVFPNINFTNTSPKEIENIIKSLRAKESYGYDGITTKILNISTLFISSPLSYIFNRSILSGIFPTRLKYTTIKPVFKNGGKKKVANYRPISILPSFSKILEKIIYFRLMNHLESSNILADEQFGFRTSSYIEHASFNFINNILNEFQQKKNKVCVIFFDLQKAFYCINHDTLLTKLEFYGITGGTFKLIKTYLQDRYQRVILNNNYSTSISDWGEITHGVPQGSILSPLLFLLYINDLPHSINKNNKIVLFADETSLIISNPDPMKFREDVSTILQHIHEWFNANLVSLNWEKTHFMYFTTKNNFLGDFDIIYKDRKLTTADSVKFLDLTLDNSTRPRSLPTLHLLHPAFEDGTDRGFRNVGSAQTDAEDIPKRTYTKFLIVFLLCDVARISTCSTSIRLWPHAAGLNNRKLQIELFVHLCVIS
jgi:hypothetical protein